MKKIVSILTIFLILILSNCFAFTENDVKNLIYNYYVNGTTYTDYDNFKNYLDNFDFSHMLSTTSNSQWYNLTEFFNNSDYSLFARRSESGQNSPLVIYFVSNNAEKPIYYSNNRYYVSNMGFLSFRVNTIPAIRCYKRNSVSNGESVGSAIDNILFFDEQNCYNPAYTSIVLSAPYNSPSWFNASGIFDAPEQKFEFEINTTDATQYVSINTEDGLINNIPIIYRWDFGKLIDDYNISFLNDNLVMYYYNGSYWKRKQFFIRNLSNGKLLTSNGYLNITNNSTFTEYNYSLTDVGQYNNVIYIYDIMNSNNDSATAIFIVGDSTTTIINGSLSFSGDYQKQFNDLNNIINNNNNNNFWKDTYNRFMKPSGEVIKQEFENTIQELIDLNILSGDVSGELDSALAGLDLINNEFGDFVISWTPTKTHFSLGGQQLDNQLLISTNSQELGNNQINFSKLERNNVEFKEVMKWVRILLSFTFISLFMRNVYFTILRTLGISTQVYDKMTEEEREQIKQEERWKNEKEKQDYQNWLRRHKK